MLALAATALAGLLAWGPAPAVAQKGFKFNDGLYRGKTVQEGVAPEFRRLEFKVKKGKVRLRAEPIVRRGFCLSLPAFTLDDNTVPVKPLSKGGRFTFTRTFFGTKIDRITGRFVSRKKIQGRAIYNFASSDLCTAGAAKVRFTVGSGKKKKQEEEQPQQPPPSP